MTSFTHDFIKVIEDWSSCSDARTLVASLHCPAEPNSVPMIVSSWSNSTALIFFSDMVAHDQLASFVIAAFVLL